MWFLNLPPLGRGNLSPLCIFLLALPGCLPVSPVGASPPSSMLPKEPWLSHAASPMILVYIV